ncbi:hypothetical protein GCM10007981_15530 [Thermocladium modestius]|uniref:Tryptophan synthase beta chain-like PALP domain-containing protein n=1 Tax=Thermocladium modestius TaxID=62609 RepID=A0A830H009_9CREN|nr:pyridoxal-phosphate dependent enzyme [Thermocladium modestius]GGP21888.1 hypothetical protein GCM10007981_15530 [Thermocladium modestius]
MLKCPKCGFSVDDYGILKCPKCGLPLLVSKGSINYRISGNKSGIWRYSSMLPKAREEVSLGEGYTPVRHMGKFLLKLEGRNPSGSYMDRGTAVWISHRMPREISLRMDGDFSKSVSLYVSRIGGRVLVSIGKTDDARDVEFYAKLGCNLCIDCVMEPSVKYGDPLMIEGYKTISIELYEQLRSINGIVVPVESGILVYSIWHGINELLEAGVLSSPPHIIGARLLGSSSDGLGNPIIDFLKTRGVEFMDVDPQDSLDAVIRLTRINVYARPISAAAYVVAEQMGNDYVAIISGSSGFKHYSRKGDTTSLQRELLQVVKSMGKATAYQVWQRVTGEVTLQGVYKALNSLVSKGLLRSEMDVRGKRRIVYFMAGDDGSKR